MHSEAALGLATKSEGRESKHVCFGTQKLVQGYGRLLPRFKKLSQLEQALSKLKLWASRVEDGGYTDKVVIAGAREGAKISCPQSFLAHN